MAELPTETFLVNGIDKFPTVQFAAPIFPPNVWFSGEYLQYAENPQPELYVHPQPTSIDSDYFVFNGVYLMLKRVSLEMTREQVMTVIDRLSEDVRARLIASNNFIAIKNPFTEEMLKNVTDFTCPYISKNKSKNS